MRLLSVPSNLNRFEESIPTLFLNCTPSYSEESIPTNTRELLRRIYETQVDSNTWRHWRRHSCDEIDVVISCTGRTTFDDRYDLALNVNALGPGRLLSFAKNCKKLKLFLHFSTERGNNTRDSSLPWRNITSDLSIQHELKLASEALNTMAENTYTFTKALGESLIQTMREDVHVVIIRPSIIESSYKEPFPGWIQGIRLKDFHC
ncbi:hypothetical protein YC2023_091138 [Brassica napus]